MPSKDNRVQIRVDDEMLGWLKALAKHWSPIGEPLTPSEVFRETLRRAYQQEFKPGKPKRPKA